MVKLAMFAAALVQASASRSESAALLQLSEGSAKLGVGADRVAYLDNMKAKMLDMIQNGVPAGAVTFLEGIITTLTDEVLTSIQQEQVDQAADHDLEYAKFGAATDAYDAEISAADTHLADTVAPEKTAHKVCRDEESVDHDQKTTCDGEQATAQTEYTSDENIVKGQARVDGVCVDETFDWRTPSVTSEATLNNMATAASNYQQGINDLIGTRNTLVAKISECAGLTADLVAKKGNCDTAQDDFERESCAHSAMYASAATTYNGAYAQAQTDFEARYSLWEDENGNRVAQCNLVNTVVCYVQALIANDDQAALNAAAATCDTNVFDCSAYEHTKSGVPAASATEATPARPCDAGFVYLDAGFPAGTEAAACRVCET